MAQRSLFLALGAIVIVSGCAGPDAGRPVTGPDDAAVPAPAPGPFAGFFDRMMGSPAATPDPSGDSGAATTPQDAAQTADLPVIPEETGEARGGFFGFLGGFGGGAATAEPAASIEIPPGTTLDYGELATVCGLSTRNLGRAVEQASGYTVYDTDPTTTAPRTHYVTGFNDGCARQFTAALALFGDIGTHEIVRYGAADGGLEYTETDNAYEAIKAEFCGARAGQPCGARLDRLARRTTFLTVYERFGTNPVWADILLHNGEVIAMDFKGDQ